MNDGYLLALAAEKMLEAWGALSPSDRTWPTPSVAKRLRQSLEDLEMALRNWRSEGHKSGSGPLFDEELLYAAQEARSALGKVVQGLDDARAAHHAYVRLDAALGGGYPIEPPKPGSSQP